MKFKKGDRVIFCNPKYEVNERYWLQVYTYAGKDSEGFLCVEELQDTTTAFMPDALELEQVYNSPLSKALR